MLHYAKVPVQPGIDFQQHQHDTVYSPPLLWSPGLASTDWAPAAGLYNKDCKSSCSIWIFVYKHSLSSDSLSVINRNDVYITVFIIITNHDTGLVRLIWWMRLLSVLRILVISYLKSPHILSVFFPWLDFMTNI